MKRACWFALTLLLLSGCHVHLITFEGSKSDDIPAEQQVVADVVEEAVNEYVLDSYGRAQDADRGGGAGDRQAD